MVFPLILTLADIETSESTNRFRLMMVLPLILTLADIDTSESTYKTLFTVALLLTYKLVDKETSDCANKYLATDKLPAVIETSDFTTRFPVIFAFPETSNSTAGFTLFIPSFVLTINPARA